MAVRLAQIVEALGGELVGDPHTVVTGLAPLGSAGPQHISFAVHERLREALKASRAGKLMMWGVGWGAGAPDGDTFLALGYGPNKGGANHARVNLPAFNRAYEAQRLLPDGPERLALMDEAKRLMVSYMPYKIHAHRIGTDLHHPWVLGYHRNLFVRDFFKYVDLDVQARERAGK